MELIKIRKIKWGILDNAEYKEAISELKAQRISAEKVGWTILEDGTALPCIKINDVLFKKLVQAGVINNTSVITTFSGVPHFFAKVEISWSSIKEKLTIILDGWRDRSFLEHLCDVKKLALTAYDNSAIVIDGLKTDDLKLNLLIASMMYHPKDVLENEQ